MRILFFSNLFPDTAEPARGLPNARLVRRLAREASVRVIAPRPVWPGFPLRKRRPLSEDEDTHPLYPPAWYLPRIGSRFNPLLMAHSVRPALEILWQQWPWDVALAAWLYPDACALCRLAAGWGSPVVAIAQGSDVHQYLQNPVRRQLMRRELSKARFLVARSQALARNLERAGFPPQRLHVIYNGVDTSRFHPGEPRLAREKLGLPREARILLWVGNLLPVKNPLLAVEAMRMLQRRFAGPAYLVMVGAGPLHEQVAQSARSAQVQIILAGRRSEADIAEFMRASDVLCLTSNAEGTPNVVLEALASGLPVAATAVGGVPEILTVPLAGRLVSAGDAPALAAALLELLQEPPDRRAVCQTAARFSWTQSVQQYLELLHQAAQP